MSNTLYVCLVFTICYLDCTVLSNCCLPCMSVWFLQLVILTALFCQTVVYLFFIIISFCLSLSCPAKGQRMKTSLANSGAFKFFGKCLSMYTVPFQINAYIK